MKFRRAIPAFAVAFGVLLALANVLLGPLNQDEGLYLAAARCVAHGLAPYRDFLFLQAPAFPFFYALLSGLWDAPGGLPGPLLSARLLTAAMGLGAAALAALAAGRLAPRGSRRAAATTAWLLVACAPLHSYYATIPKTYALASLFLAAGLLCLCHAGETRGSAFGAGVAIGLAAATRHSLALAAPAACLALWLGAPRGRRAAGFRLAFFCGLGVLFSFGPALFALAGTPGGRFTLAYHHARAVPGLATWIALRAGFLSRTAQAYPLLWCLVAFLAAISLAGRRAATRPPAALPAAWAAALAVTAAHFLAPFPYDDYQTPVMPVLAAAASASLWRLFPAPGGPAAHRRTAALALAALVLAAGSPLLLDWALVRKDRLWFDIKRVPDTLALRAAGRRLRALADEEGGTRYVLTQDAYLAVESGLPLPRGLEMGPFSFFPHLSDDEARRHRVHNASTLRRMMSSPFAPAVAATSGYDFAIDCPSAERVPDADRQSLLDDLARFYEPVETVPDFGQSHTTLTLWRRRAPAPPDAVPLAVP